MSINKLTDTAVKNAAPKEKDYKVADGGGLYLLVKKSGTKCWRYSYRFGGKQKTLSIGIYPEVSLKSARESHTQARSNLRENKDPSLVKKLEKRIKQGELSDSFASIAKEWWEYQKDMWTSDHANRVWLRLEDNAFPTIGTHPIDQIKPMDVIQIAKQIEARGALDVASRVVQDINRVCRYAVQVGKIEYNPASDLQGVIKPRKTKHRPSLPKAELHLFLKDLDQYRNQGTLLTEYALKLLLLTFIRPGELIDARWCEFELEDRIWRIPAGRMKGKKSEHLVPLSNQTLNLLGCIREISGNYELLFPSERNRKYCMSDNTMRRAMIRMGYDGNTPGKSHAVPHGFRTTASSVLNEKGFNPDAVERQLHHVEKDKVRAAYNHATYLPERREMMQWWGDFLDRQLTGDSSDC